MKPEHQAILDDIRENHAKRDSCAGHEFLPPRDKRTLADRKLTCSRCGSWADVVDAIWYENGERDALRNVARKADGSFDFEAEARELRARVAAQAKRIDWTVRENEKMRTDMLGELAAERELKLAHLHTAEVGIAEVAKLRAELTALREKAGVVDRLAVVLVPPQVAQISGGPRFYCKLLVGGAHGFGSTILEAVSAALSAAEAKEGK